MKKYLVCGGNVLSKSDGEWHYVSARKVAKLYGVNPNECIMLDFETDAEIKGRDTENLIILRPDYSGDYNLNKVMKG